MYRLLVVDDVPDIVDWLYELFLEESKLDIEVLKAYSGEEALGYLNSRKIDIVLSDIKMPGINGLQLLEKIKQNWPICKVIFLTGYNEFDYIYTAIQYEDVSYLLKTEEDEVIIRSVEKAIEAVEKKLKAVELLANAKEHMDIVLPLLQKEFMLEILQGAIDSSEIRQQRFDELKIPLNCRNDTLLLMGYMQGQEKLLTIDWAQYVQALQVIYNKIIPGVIASFAITVQKPVLVWFLQLKDCETENTADNYQPWKKVFPLLKGALESIQDACRESLNVRMSFVLDTEPASLQEIHARYELIRNMLNDSISLGHELILTDKSFMSPGSGQIFCKDDSADVFLPGTQKLETLKTYLERGQRQEFFSLLASVTDCLKEVKSKHNNLALEVYYSITTIYLAYINRRHLAEKLAFKISLYRLMRVNEHDSWLDAVNYLNQIGECIFDVQGNDNYLKNADAIEYIMKYVSENLGGDLSLDRLAEMVYFNPAYLSRLFKQVTGIKLSNYICEMRIKKAKELLENDSMKIQDIAAAVGFDSSRYFAHLFKNMTKVNPQEYRETYQRSK